LGEICRCIEHVATTGVVLSGQPGSRVAAGWQQQAAAFVALQACARHKYIWGVNYECSEIVLNVLELRKVIASMRHALSIVCYVQFLLANLEFLNMVYTYKKDQVKNSGWFILLFKGKMVAVIL